MNHKLIDQELQSIWQNENYKAFTHRPFMYHEEILEDAILFIGINPAYNKEHEAITSYKLQQGDNELTYFRKMGKIAEYAKHTWTHLDLFYFRETNQKWVHKFLKEEHGIGFLWGQLQLTRQLIEKATPKVIVVSNALASYFMGLYKNEKAEEEKDRHIWMGLDFEFDETIGTHRWNNTPVFFTSMLSGQRALDRGSYERLKWHVQWVMGK